MKVHCPYHDDTTPSMHCYEEYAHCFVCNAHVPVEEVLSAEEIKNVIKTKTDVSGMIAHIAKLPVEKIRGLDLPMDLGGYFIVWPDKSYYRKRMFRGETRYIGPRGVRPPLLKAKVNRSKNLVIIEGEINALTLAKYYSELNWDIVSPGSANNLRSYIDFYLQYSRIVCILDKDIPGVVAGLKLKDELLLKYKRNVQLIAVETDFNEVLETQGKEGLKKWWQDNMDLPRGL